MSLFQIQIETEHAILFLSDSKSSSTPETLGAEFAVATEDCLCFCVLSPVDGASLVTITDRDCDRGGRKVFAGSIHAASGVLSLTDSGDFGYLNVPVPAGQLSLEIWADDEQNPEWVWVKLGAIRAC